jgi:hypothetical protein
MREIPDCLCPGGRKADAVTVSGIVPIVSGSGTGAYEGIIGTFTLTVIVAEDFP